MSTECPPCAQHIEKVEKEVSYKVGCQQPDFCVDSHEILTPLCLSHPVPVLGLFLTAQFLHAFFGGTVTCSTAQILSIDSSPIKEPKNCYHLVTLSCREVVTRCVAPVFSGCLCTAERHL